MKMKRKKAQRDGGHFKSGLNESGPFCPSCGTMMMLRLDFRNELHDGTFASYEARCGSWDDTKHRWWIGLTKWNGKVQEVEFTSVYQKLRTTRRVAG